LIYGGSVVINQRFRPRRFRQQSDFGGGSLQVNASTTNASRPVSVVAASTIGVITNATYQLGGRNQRQRQSDQDDDGTLILTGNNTETGNLTVNQGTLRSTGTEVLPAVVRIGNAAGLSGVLAVSSGTFQAANNGGQFASGLIAGAAAGSAGDIVLSGGTVLVQHQLGLGAGWEDTAP